MTIPVAWVSYHEPDIIRRGYWDQGLLERVFDRSLWRPAGALAYRHYEGLERVPEDAGGAVVVVPAQHHADPTDVARLNAELARLGWVLLILTGDECSHFPWRQVNHPNLALWVMTPQPERHAGCPARFIGEGFRYDTPAVLAGYADEAHAKPLDWFFAGQVTHTRRRSLVGALRRTKGQGDLHETPGFTQGLPREQYLRRLAAAKVAPCPAGACTPDSFRLYEALEAGCVPILDDTSPGGWKGFWSAMGAAATPPALIVDDWRQAPGAIAHELAHWPVGANRAGAWWQGYKRDLAYALDDDVRRLAGAGVEAHRLPEGLEDLITVLVPTSPIPSHPDTAIIAETLDSITERLGPCETLVLVDGVRKEQEMMRSDYEEYQRRLLWRLNHGQANAVPLRFEDHHHQAAMTAAALERVRTPLVLFVEHDTPLVGERPPWEAFAEAITQGHADVIRLHHEAQVLEPHRYLMADSRPQQVCGAPLLRTAQWSQRPHLASAEWYRKMLDQHFPGHARTMIEDKFYGEVATPWVEHGSWGGACKLWLYAPPGDIKRSTHLDGRAGEPKYEMTW